jgi:hypothetical protein
MLTGKRAFRKGTSAETLSALLNEEPLPLAQSVQNFPPSSPPGQILAPSISPARAGRVFQFRRRDFA